jgi:hypothetical protein
MSSARPTTVVCDIICRRYFVIICRKLFPCGSWRRGQLKPVNVRHRAVSCSTHTLKMWGATYGRDGSEVCFRTSRLLIVHLRTDATNIGKISTTNNVTSYTLGLTTLYGTRNAWLVYLFWEPTNAESWPQCAAHRAEANDLAARVQHSKVKLKPMSF